MTYVLAVIDDYGAVRRWRRYSTIRLALAHGRRNSTAGRLCWIEGIQRLAGPPSPMAWENGDP